MEFIADAFRGYDGVMTDENVYYQYFRWF